MTRATWPVVAALALFWVLLWNDARPIVIVGGLLVALLVVGVFPFPSVRLTGAVRPWSTFILIARFFVDLVVASIQVGWIVLRPQPPPSPGLIEVQLVNRSEALQVLTVELISLVPGSLLIELDADTGRAWLHVLDASTSTQVAKARRHARIQEHRVLSAFGTAAERDRSAKALREDDQKLSDESDDSQVPS